MLRNDYRGGKYGVNCTTQKQMQLDDTININNNIIIAAESMDYKQEISPATVLHWNYRGFTEFPLNRIDGEESEVTDIYLKENLISQLPKEICRLENLESLYLSGNDITELPKEISHLRCLKCLDLSGNRLKRVPDEIGELRSLKFLIFDENELTELPLRLRELRALRYLSVCDNQLQWLPQRPVFNYHHCEFRFWRNTSLQAIPYSLWYHMFRDQQTRSLNIGCLGYALFPQIAKNNKIRLKIVQDSREWECDLNIPSQHDNVMETNKCSPPSLFELCRRLVYEIISNTARKQTNVIDETYPWRNFNNFDRIRSLQQTFEGINIDNDFNLDINGKSTMKSINNVINNKNRSYYVPTDIIDEHLGYLPQLIKKDICNGPISKCENLACKRPIFDYLFYEFCFGKLILIDNIADVLLSATFCSKACAEVWKNGKAVISWSLLGR